jgi:hypothetical protein
VGAACFAASALARGGYAAATRGGRPTGGTAQTAEPLETDAHLCLFQLVRCALLPRMAQLCTKRAAVQEDRFLPA